MMRPCPTLQYLLTLGLATQAPVWADLGESGPEAESPPAIEQPALPADLATPASAVAAGQIRALLAAGQADAALAAANDALQQFPDAPELLHAKGAVERHQGDHRAAVATYERLLKIDPADPIAAPILALLLQELATQTGDKKAVSLLRRALELSPEDQPTRLAYALAAARARQPADVIAAYEGLDAATQQRPDLLHAAAESYAQQQDFARAADLLANLLDATPRDRTTVDAFVQAASRLPAEAMRTCLARAAAQHPDNPDLLRATARLALEQNDVWTGLQMVSRVLLLDPADSEAAGMKTALLADLGCIELAREFLDAHTDSIDATVAEGIRTRAEACRQQWAAVDANAIVSGGPANLLTLSYGDVQDAPAAGRPALRMADLISQLDYLHGHGFRFLSNRDVLAARRHKTALPQRSVLLLVQGGYASFAQRILPLLEQYNCPVVLALPTAPLEGEASTPPDAPLLTWDQIRILAKHPLVTLASQTHNLGEFVQGDPQGRMAPAAVTRIYSSTAETYENAQEYRARIATDLKISLRVIESQAERMTDLLVWPAGAFNGVTLETARALDFAMLFAAGSAEMPTSPDLFPTLPVTPGMGLDALARQIWSWGLPLAPTQRVMTAMPLDLAALTTETPAVTRANLAAAVERAVNLGFSRVYISACADNDGNGAADAAFFPNRVLPVQEDILSYAVDLLQQRGLEAHVVMPSLGIQMPVKEPDVRLLVMQYRWGRITPTGSPHSRLSPFNPEVCRMIRSLYEDLGAYVAPDGVLLGLDAFLTEAEDAGPTAAKIFQDQAGLRERNPAVLTPAQREQRLDVKMAVLDALLDDLYRITKALRPRALCTRALAGAVVVDPEARAQYSQDYRVALARFDGIWVDATPELYTSSDPDAWIEELAAAVAAHPGARDKTVFAMGLRGREDSSWLSRSDWADRVRAIVERGGRQLAYYPDEGPGEGLPKGKVVLKIHQIANEAARATAE